MPNTQHKTLHPLNLSFQRHTLQIMTVIQLQKRKPHIHAPCRSCFEVGLTCSKRQLEITLAKARGPAQHESAEAPYTEDSGFRGCDF